MTQQALQSQWEAWMGIRIAFTRSGMTQLEFSDRLGWDPSKVSRTLTGKRHVTEHDLRDIVRVLGGNYAYYIDGPAGVTPDDPANAVDPR